MNSTDTRRRRILLILCSILIPSAVLVTLGIRLVRQETELSEKRSADERREAVEQLRREMSARLEAIRLKETDRLAGESNAAPSARHPDSPVVFAAPIEKDHLSLPWETGRAPRTLSPKFQNYQKAGESLEFGEKAYASALNAYRYALASASNRIERCKANLWLGRVFVKDGKTGEAADIYRPMLKDCDAAIDEEGIPLSLYASDRLISADLDPEAARQYVVELASRDRWLAPVAAYLMRSLLTGQASPDAEMVRKSLSDEIHESEQILGLAADIQRLGRPKLTFHINSSPSWFAYGDDPWLITIIPAEAGRTSTAVLAVSSRKIMMPGVRFLDANSRDGFAIGEGFADLRAEWTSGRFVARPVPYLTYGFGLALILAITILVGFLLMRDIDRQVQTAEMRQHFAASVSHELKTPLTAIRMFAETLESGRSSNPQAQAKYLRTIVSESERLSRLVDNVLDFVRIEQDRKIYQMQRVCLADVVRSAIQAIQYPLARQNFELRVALEDNLPELMADPDAVEQAILNLLANALKYSGEARQIDLQLRRESEEAVIEVTDHGLGIAEENHSRIFDKFYRVRSTETDRVPGAGLGLTLVMHAVKAHGGRLLVSSTLGAGSTFSIRLPFMKEEANA